MRNRLVIGTTLALVFPLNSLAGTAMCSIEIDDVNRASTYTLAHTFVFEKGGAGQRKHFQLPGNDYNCTLAFFELGQGTMLSCESKDDPGHTFFQSDRTALRDNTGSNNLSFRHKSAFIVLTTLCK